MPGRHWPRESQLFFELFTSDTRSTCPQVRADGQLTPKTGLLVSGQGGGQGKVERPAHEFPVNEAHTCSFAIAVRPQPMKWGGAGRNYRSHKCITNREKTIQSAAVRLRARAAGLKPVHQRVVAVFPLQSTQEIGRDRQEDGGRV